MTRVIRLCSLGGCDSKHFVHGYCSKHWLQYKRHGRIIERTRYDRNEIIMHPDYAEIVLCDISNREVGRTKIDIEDLGLVEKYRWHLSRSGYAFSHQARFLHRFVMGANQRSTIDHKKDKLDNRKTNLRLATQQENTFNQSKRLNAVGFKGVTWSKSEKQFIAQIMKNGKNYRLGAFLDPSLAAAAYDKAAEDLFGEFARTNKMLGLLS